MNAPTPKLKRGLLSRWLGVSPSASPEYVPMQLLALEERVLYSAGPIPAEVVDVELVSQGNFEGVDANDLGLNSLELDSNGTIEYLQQQIDAANSLESIDAIQPLELVPSDLGVEGEVNPEAAEVLADQLTDEAVELSAAAVASDLQGSERVTAAVSAGFDPGYTISGRILHDVNGDGSVDENIGLEGVEVRAFRDIGNGTLEILDLFANGSLTETTDSNGYYEFTDLLPDSTYFIVVGSTSLGEHFELNGLLNAGYSKDDIWGEQTYAAEGALFDRGAGQEVHDGGAFYGGFNADQPDGVGGIFGFNRFEHVIRRSVTNFDHLNVDFGFSFNVVTNTLGGGFQDDAPAGRTVQGSLRQFITNANAIAGDNEMRFVPAVDETYTSTTGDVWLIDIENALPSIVDAGTTISGLAYNTDGSLFAATAANVSPNGSVTGGGVDDTLLGPSFHPVLTLSGLSNPVNAGLIGEAAFFEVSNLALVNFSTGIVVQGEDASNAFIHDNFIGVHADGSQATVAQANGVVVLNADEGRIFDNYIVDSTNSGILISGSLGTGDHAEDWRIQDNYIVKENFAGAFSSDGIGLTGGTDGAIVSNNRIENAEEFGIDLWNNRGAVTIENNTIANSGSIRAIDNVLVGGGIGLTSGGNVVRNNEIIDNNATGILVRGTAQSGGSDFLAATGNLISTNYFEGNAGLDIDITRPQDNPVADGSLEVSTGDGMDALDGLLDSDTGSNGIDHPVLTEVSLAGNLLTIKGSHLNLISDPQIELYLLGANGSKLYFDTVNVTDQTSYDPVTGEFSARLTEPVAGWPDDFVVGSSVAAIVIDGATSDTSEFGLATAVTLTNQPAEFVGSAVDFDVAENSTRVEEFISIDPEGGAREYSIVGGADANLFAIGETSGVLSFRAAPDFENPTDSDGSISDNDYSLTIRVEDEQGLGTEREITVTVTNEDEIAEFSQDEFSQLEGQIDQFQLNAVADDGSSFTYQLQPGGSSSALNFDSNTGSFSLRDQPDFENPADENGVNIYSFTVTATTATGYWVTSEIDLRITDVEEGATVSATDFSTFENQQDVFTLNAIAADGSAFDYTVIGGPDQDAFTFTPSGNNFGFQLSAAPDYEAPADRNGDNVYEFVLRAESDTGHSTVERITVSVKDVSEVATLSQSEFVQEENRTDQFQLNAVAPDGSTFSYQLFSGDDSAAIDFDGATGEFSLLTAPDFENATDVDGDGVYLFKVSGTSTTGYFIVETITVTVADENEVATLPQTNFSQQENSIDQFQLNAVAADGSSFTYELLPGEDNAAIEFDANTGEFSLLTAPDFENAADANSDGVYSFKVSATSTTGYFIIETISVTVADENEVATLPQTNFTQQENSIDQFQLNAVAADGSSFTYELLPGEDNAAIEFDANTGEFSLLTAQDFENAADANGDGVYSFKVSATSTTGYFIIETISVTVADVVETAVFATTDFVTLENGIDSFAFDAIASNGSELNYSIVGGDDFSEIRLSADGTQFSLSDIPNFEALADFDGDNVFEFTVRAQSDSGIDVTQEIRISIADDVETVLATDDTGVVGVGGTVQIDVLTNDAVDPLDRLDAVEIVNVSNGVASFNRAGQLEFVHDGTKTTSAEVTYRIINQEGDISSATVNIVVNPVIDLAQIANDNFELDSAQGPALINVLANDSVAEANLGEFRVQIVQPPSQGTATVDADSGDVEFIPLPNFNGVDSFQYQLVSSDGQQVLSDVASVSVELRQPTVPTQDAEPVVVVENEAEDSSPEVISSDRSVSPPEDEREEVIPPSIVLTADSVVAGRGYVTPDDLSSTDGSVGLSLEFEANAYTYLGRTQFLELANLELSEFKLRDSIQGDANQNNQIFLSQLIVGVSDVGSSDSGEASELNVGDKILQTAPFMGVLAGCVGLTTLTVTGSQMYRSLDVGSLLTDDESIEDIISS